MTDFLGNLYGQATGQPQAFRPPARFRFSDAPVGEEAASNDWDAAPVRSPRAQAQPADNGLRDARRAPEADEATEPFPAAAKDRSSTAPHNEIAVGIRGAEIAQADVTTLNRAHAITERPHLTGEASDPPKVSIRPKTLPEDSRTIAPRSATAAAIDSAGGGLARDVSPETEVARGEPSHAPRRERADAPSGHAAVRSEAAVEAKDISVAVEASKAKAKADRERATAPAVAEERIAASPAERERDVAPVRSDGRQPNNAVRDAVRAIEFPVTPPSLLDSEAVDAARSRRAKTEREPEPSAVSAQSSPAARPLARDPAGRPPGVRVLAARAGRDAETASNQDAAPPASIVRRTEALRLSGPEPARDGLRNVADRASSAMPAFEVNIGRIQLVRPATHAPAAERPKPPPLEKSLNGRGRGGR